MRSVGGLLVASVHNTYSVDVEDAMVPAPLLLRLRKHRGQRPPDANMAVADLELRRVESASLEIPQDGRPALRRLA